MAARATRQFPSDAEVDYINSLADAAFHRQFVVAMLEAPGLNYLDIAPGSRQRKLKPVDAVAALDLIQQP
jgi:hypothetical protein